MAKDFDDKNDEKRELYSHTSQGFSSSLAQNMKPDCFDSKRSVLDGNWY